MERFKLEKRIRDAMTASAGVGWAHVKHEGRRVTIWPILGTLPLGRFNLQLVDSDFDLSRTIGGGYVDSLSRRDVIRTILVFLCGNLIEDDCECFDLHINQADRECFVAEDSVTPTRLRITYDLPASGEVDSWRHHVSFEMPRSEVSVSRHTGIIHRGAIQNVRYLARLYW